MDKAKGISSVTPSSNIDQVKHTSYDSRENYPNEYFDDYMYDDLYYDDICMSCSHWIDGVCMAEQGVCDYEHY